MSSKSGEVQEVTTRAPVEKKVEKKDSTSILAKAIKSGLAGASAMAIQVVSLMWMRTTMNYQFKNGGGFIPTLKKLYAEGGIPRFYRGVVPALIIGPMSRFGDTASNLFALTLFERS